MRARTGPAPTTNTKETSPSKTQLATQIAPDLSCNDTDDNVLDWHGDSCSIYYTVPSECGRGGTPDFDSTRVCCACGGGTDFQSKNDTDMAVDTAPQGKNCSWLPDTNSSGCVKKLINIGSGLDRYPCAYSVFNNKKCGNGMFADGNQCLCEARESECEGTLTDYSLSDNFTKYTNMCPGTVVLCRY